ncbi:MAG: TetR/AcrR family transcriptional regulator C-terminal domain-containing protein [Clostridia bacterium]|nr:TetR/AcrR family transcriptional regulator C-terminal domain-containing protein [Clostridia bacterium]
MAPQNSGEKTKLLIANSLRKLMKKKSLDKIKIREIVEDCNVNRQTFYYHFQDIYALVEWIYTYDGMQIFNEYKNDCDWMTMIRKMFDYLEDHQEEIKCVVNSKAEKFFYNFVHEKIGLCSRMVVEFISKDMTVDSYYKSFIADFYTFAVCDVVENWMRNRSSTRISSDELIHLFELTMLGNVKAALERFEQETIKLREADKNS